MAKRRGYRRKGQRYEIEWFGDAFVEIVQEHGDEALFLAGELLQHEAENRAPNRTGRLHGSGYVATAKRSSYRARRYWRREKKPPKSGAVIAFTAPHAHLVEGGRRSRGVIAPRPKGGKRALRIGRTGQIRARSRFNRASSRPFLGPAIEASQTTLTRELARVLGGWLQRLLP